ncbi:MAG: hypothetical protein IJU79_05850 [Desulfovibrionaceae bacterium]|nr:hypothetical protein [Desulfovibrionaceae bacterium]
MSQIEKILTVLCESYRPICEKRLLKAWKNYVSPDCTGPQAHAVFKCYIDSETTLKEELFSEFTTYVLDNPTLFENEQSPIQRYNPCLPPDELDRTLRNIVNHLVKNYINNGVIETLRKDPTTFNSLYHSVQKFTKKYHTDILYGANSQYVGLPDLDDNTFAEAVADAVFPYDDELMAIPLPNDAPKSVSCFFQKTGQKHYVAKPFMDLLAYYIDAVASQDLGEVVQLRTFVAWVNKHYNLLPILIQMSDTGDDEYGLPNLASLKDEAALDSEEQTICQDSAKEIFNRMSNDVRRVLIAVCEGDKAKDLQKKLGLKTEQQAYAVIRKLKLLIKSNSAAMPELAACGKDAKSLFLQLLFMLCKDDKTLN